MEQLETVKVVDENPNNRRGWKIINKSDMTEENRLYEEPKQVATSQEGEKGGSQNTGNQHQNKGNRR